MGKKNRFKKVSRDVGRKLEKAPTMRLDKDAQAERFARNQWYRYFVQIEAKYRMIRSENDMSQAHQTMTLLGMPVGIDPDSELGQKIEAERRDQAEEVTDAELIAAARRTWGRSR